MSFTIKHRESDALGGNEYFYTAYDVKVVRKGEHFEDGIYLDPNNEQTAGLFHDGPYPAPALASPPPMARVVILFGGDQTDDAKARCGGKVWIMNDGGATIGSYEL